MGLREFLKDHTELIYLGGDESSGFIWIGPAADMPKKYLKLEVIETYPHTVDYPGTTVIVHSDERRALWSWHECDPKVKRKKLEFNCTEVEIENLLVGIAKQCASDYRGMIRRRIKSYPDRRKHQEIDKAILKARKAMDLDFLEASETGRYVIQGIEDEERIMAYYPHCMEMPYEKRYKFIRNKRQQMIAKRAMEKDVYAKIRGKSVKHE